MTDAAKADIEQERNNGSGDDVDGDYWSLEKIFCILFFSSIGEVFALDTILLMGDPASASNGDPPKSLTY